MIENIDLIKLDLNTLSKIKETFDYNILLSLATNYENINKVIDLLTRLGIENINEMFIYEYNVFLMDPSSIYSSLISYNIEEAINNINEDFTFIEDII